MVEKGGESHSYEKGQGTENEQKGALLSVSGAKRGVSGKSLCCNGLLCKRCGGSSPPFRTKLHFLR